MHLNPVRAKWLKADQPLRAYRWSSYPEYLRPASQRAAWLRVDRLLGQWNIGSDRAAGGRQCERGQGQMLRKARWTEGDLVERRKGDEGKVQMAARLRGETTMSWKWIAQRLSMGHWRSAANAVRGA